MICTGILDWCSPEAAPLEGNHRRLPTASTTHKGHQDISKEVVADKSDVQFATDDGLSPDRGKDQEQLSAASKKFIINKGENVHAALGIASHTNVAMEGFFVKDGG